MFLYIGIESYKLSFELNRSSPHEAVYFTELEEAKRFIYKAVLDSSDLPGAIICDATYSKTDLIKFLLRISFSGKVAFIPFILFSTHLTDQEKIILGKMRGVDDVYNRMGIGDNLVERIKFLQFFKVRKQSYLPLKEEIEEVYPELLVDIFLKRFLDITVALSLLILLSPLLILISILIKLESRGPVFYSSLRAGSNYKIFKFYKFRSMQQNADSKVSELMNDNEYQGEGGQNPVFFKLQNDPRITRFGTLLRNTSLDEIPQLVNVLKGDMSLVGNRPLPLYEAVALTQDQWAARFLAPAGMTGLWQITKRGKKDMSVLERINLDLTYAKKNSLLKDMWILIKTPRALLQKENV